MDHQFENDILPWIGRIERQLSILMRDGLAQLDLTYPEFRLVGLLWGEEDGVSQKHLAERLGLDASGISVTLKRLEKKGHVERVRDPEDARVVRVKAAQSVYGMTDVLNVYGAQEAAAKKDLTKEEIETLTDLLRRVNANLTQHSKLI